MLYNDRMRLVFVLLTIVFFFPAQSMAQDMPSGTNISLSNTGSNTSDQIGEITNEPQCFNIINKAPYTVVGTFKTDIYITQDGIKARHNSNFRLTVEEQAEFCAYGPFYEGRKLELTLRTIVPIFSCKTAITEDILIYGRRKSGGGTETWATCL